jgi:hypothetical protein
VDVKKRIAIEGSTASYLRITDSLGANNGSNRYYGAITTKEMDYKGIVDCLIIQI